MILYEDGDDFEEGEDSDLESWEDFKKSVYKILKQNKSKHYQSLPKKIWNPNAVKKEDLNAEYNFNDHAINQGISTQVQNNTIEIDNFDGVDKSLYRSVIEGKVAPQNRLDLHGCILVEAERIVPKFIVQSYMQGLRLVLIITGKGDSANPTNTLRGNLPGFLNSQNIKNMILFAATAAPKHGGAGACYVFLRKKRA